MTETTVNKNLEQKLRRALHKHGYSLYKSRKRISSNNFGGYMIVWDVHNACVAGASFNLGLNDVADWVKDLCK